MELLSLAACTSPKGVERTLGLAVCVSKVCSGEVKSLAFVNLARGEPSVRGDFKPTGGWVLANLPAAILFP